MSLDNSRQRIVPASARMYVVAHGLLLRLFLLRPHSPRGESSAQNNLFNRRRFAVERIVELCMPLLI